MPHMVLHPGKHRRLPSDSQLCSRRWLLQRLQYFPMGLLYLELAGLGQTYAPSSIRVLDDHPRRHSIREPDLCSTRPRLLHGNARLPPILRTTSHLHDVHHRQLKINDPLHGCSSDHVNGFLPCACLLPRKRNCQSRYFLPHHAEAILGLVWVVL